MFFVTFHETVTNVYAFDDDGNLLNPASPDVLDKKGQKLKELRGLAFSTGGKLLYVVNGDKTTSNVLCFQGSGTSYTYKSTLIPSPDANPAGPASINHPFAIAFDNQSHCFVSNQDSNVVAAFNVARNGESATTAFPASPYLTAQFPTGQFLGGTLVASSEGTLPEVKVSPPPVDVRKVLGGLGVSIVSGKVQNSVRDVLSVGTVLFVVDEPGGLVRIYETATGQPLRVSNQVTSPVHLLLNNETLYVGAGNQVLSSPLPDPYAVNAPTWVFSPITQLSNLPGSVSGMAFDSAGNFHVAIRTKNQVLKFTPDFSSSSPWPVSPEARGQLPDNPEFLLYISSPA